MAVASRSGGRRRAVLTVVEYAVAAGLIAAVVVGVGNPDALLHPVDGRWLLVALAAQVVSFVAAVGGQRAGLLALGARVRRTLIARVTLVSTGLGYLLPGGSAVGTAWSARRLHRAGVPDDAAAGSQLLSAGSVAVSLSLLGLGGVLLAGGAGALGDGGATAVVAGSAIGLAGGVPLVVLAALPGARRRLAGWRPVRWLLGPASASERASTHERPVLLPLTVVAGVAFFFADLVCLAGVLRAYGVHVDEGALLAAYAAAQVLSLVPITPGGAGLVEGGLAGLLLQATHSAHGVAAGVLGYRVLGCWSYVLVGGVALLLETRRAKAAAAVPVVAPAVAEAVGEAVEAVGERVTATVGAVVDAVTPDPAAAPATTG